MTTYRCAACSTILEVEKLPIGNIVEVKPCEACLEAAEETALEDAQNQCYRDGYAKGRQEGEVKGVLSTVMKNTEEEEGDSQ